MNLCVFGASSNQLDDAYLQAVEDLGRALGKHGHGLVFGGGAQGLMGAAARGAKETGAYILGIAPSFFHVDGVLYENCDEFLYTETMRERKQLMEDRSDAVIMVPGGIGTFEEFFEILTLKQLGRINKPIAVYNVCGYFDDMQKMLERAIRERFMTPECAGLYRVFTEPEPLLSYVETYEETPESIAHLKNI